MASPVEICNISLTYIGAENIESLDPNNKRSRACNIMYPFALKSLLSDGYEWSFSRKVVTLRQSVGVDSSQTYGVPYDKPADCIRPIDILPVGSRQNWELVGDIIYTNTPSPELLYVRSDIDTGLFPNHFVSALAMTIASLIVHSIKQSPNFDKNLATQAAIAVAEAQETDARIGSTYREPDSDPNNDSFVNPDVSVESELPTEDWYVRT